MSFKTNRFAALTKITGALILALITLTLPARAGDIMVMEPYARSSSAKAVSGAAFMTIKNNTDSDDQLIDVYSDVAKKTELHTHIETDEGIMQMRHVPEGFPVPKGGTIELKRGGHHVMFMGIIDSFEQGDMIPLTLVFKNAGEVVIDVPVDLTRKPGKMMGTMTMAPTTDG